MSNRRLRRHWRTLGGSLLQLIGIAVNPGSVGRLGQARSHTPGTPRKVAKVVRFLLWIDSQVHARPRAPKPMAQRRCVAKVAGRLTLMSGKPTRTARTDQAVSNRETCLASQRSRP